MTTSFIASVTYRLVLIAEVIVTFHGDYSSATSRSKTSETLSSAPFGHDIRSLRCDLPLVLM